jgi:hypothetical protein
MVIDQPNIIGLSLLCVFLPFSALFHNLIFFQVEMPTHHSLKPLRWVADVVGHGVLYVTVSDDVRISLVLLFAFLCALLVLKPGLVEVDLLAHDDSLDGQ